MKCYCCCRQSLRRNIDRIVPLTWVLASHTPNELKQVLQVDYAVSLGNSVVWRPSASEMKSGDEATHAAAHTKPIVIARNPEDEVECTKCHMYFGLRGTIEAHEKRHAAHTDDQLYRFQNPKDYTVDSSKPAEGPKLDQFRKQRGLELALKNEVVEPALSGGIQLDVGVGGSGASIGGAPKQASDSTAPQGGTSTGV